MPLVPLVPLVSATPGSGVVVVGGRGPAGLGLGVEGTGSAAVLHVERLPPLGLGVVLGVEVGQAPAGLGLGAEGAPAGLGYGGLVGRGQAGARGVRGQAVVPRRPIVGPLAPPSLWERPMESRRRDRNGNVMKRGHRLRHSL